MRVIYGTNLRTSYAAGRFRQLKEDADVLPYWQYRYSHVSQVPRPHHLGRHDAVARRSGVADALGQSTVQSYLKKMSVQSPMVATHGPGKCWRCRGYGASCVTHGKHG